MDECGFQALFSGCGGLLGLSDDSHEAVGKDPCRSTYVAGCCGKKRDPAAGIPQRGPSKSTGGLSATDISITDALANASRIWENIERAGGAAREGSRQPVLLEGPIVYSAGRCPTRSNTGVSRNWARGGNRIECAWTRVGSFCTSSSFTRPRKHCPTHRLRAYASDYGAGDPAVHLDYEEVSGCPEATRHHS